MATLFLALSSVNKQQKEKTKTMFIFCHKIKWNGMAYRRLAVFMLLKIQFPFHSLEREQMVAWTRAFRHECRVFILTKQSRIQSHKKESTFLCTIKFKNSDSF